MYNPKNKNTNNSGALQHTKAISEQSRRQTFYKNAQKRLLVKLSKSHPPKISDGSPFYKLNRKLYTTCGDISSVLSAGQICRRMTESKFNSAKLR